MNAVFAFASSTSNLFAFLAPARTLGNTLIDSELFSKTMHRIFWTILKENYTSVIIIGMYELSDSPYFRYLSYFVLRIQHVKFLDIGVISVIYVIPEGITTMGAYFLRFLSNDPVNGTYKVLCGLIHQHILWTLEYIFKEFIALRKQQQTFHV